MKRKSGMAALLLGVLGLAAGSGGAGARTSFAQLQSGIPSAGQNGSQHGTNSRDGDANHSPFAEQAAEKQVAARNDDRQKRLEADTDKLLQLATQLHEDVAKTNKNVLSVDVVKRAQEIEKLAHDVKERMKG